MDEIMNNLNLIVEKYLHANGVSIKFFAQWIGVDRSTAQKWIKGERSMPKDKIERVWKFLNGEFLTTFDQIVTVKEG